MTRLPSADRPPPPSTLARGRRGTHGGGRDGHRRARAGLTVPEASPVVAVGQAAIDLTPQPVKDFAISTFGANDKNALLAGILIILAAFAAVIGILAVRRLALGLAGLAVFACIGLTAALTRPTATAQYAIPTLVGAAAGAFALTRLIRPARRLTVRPRRAGSGLTVRPGSADSGLSAPPESPGRGPGVPVGLRPPDLPLRRLARGPLSPSCPTRRIPVPPGGRSGGGSWPPAAWPW